MKVCLDENVLLDSKQLELLFEILHTNSPSGCEHQIVNILRKHMSEYCDVKTDVIGNLYMEVGNRQGLTVMISAHSDEVGLQVVYIDYDDYYNYSNYDNYDNYGDYHNYNDYHNYDQYSDSGCFITSAVCKTFGKPDDCRELMTFRAFRDTYMKGDETLNGEVNNYYEVAPKICDAIDAKGEAAAKIEYEWIWNIYLSKAYDALNNNESKKAYEIYKDMVLRLQDIYL